MAFDGWCAFAVWNGTEVLVGLFESAALSESSTPPQLSADAEANRAARLHELWGRGLWARFTFGAVFVGSWLHLSDQVLSDLRCPVPGTDSDYGRRRWSWSPLGARCHLHDGAVTNPPVMWPILAGFGALWALAGPTPRLTGRHARQPESTFANSS